MIRILMLLIRIVICNMIFLGLLKEFCIKVLYEFVFLILLNLSKILSVLLVKKVMRMIIMMLGRSLRIFIVVGKVMILVLMIVVVRLNIVLVKEVFLNFLWLLFFDVCNSGLVGWFWILFLVVIVFLMV